MDKAKIYKGIKIKRYNGAIENIPYPNFEYYKKVARDTYGCEFINKEPELFLCSLLKIDDDLSNLYAFREDLAKEKGYNTLLSRAELEEKLNEGYIVAANGLGEIKNLEELA